MEVIFVWKKYILYRYTIIKLKRSHVFADEDEKQSGNWANQRVSRVAVEEKLVDLDSLRESFTI